LPEEPIPSTLQILQGASPAKSGKVYVHFPVGSRFKYSGGGITVIQKIIEDITGLTYHEAAQQHLFAPLQLKRTSYENPLPSSMGNIAKAHNRLGDPVAIPRGYQSMPEKAASGLWTTPSDLATILSAIIASSENERGIITPVLIEDMITPEVNTEFGLGPKIEYRNGQTIVFHNGANDSYRAHFKVYWEQKTGYVIFTNGTNGLDLIQELQPLLDNLL
ncbi:MAG: serine hydrolase domain-containing protein, partial [Bacteroidota bacterium]